MLGARRRGTSSSWATAGAAASPRRFDDRQPLTSTDFIGTWVAGLRDLGTSWTPPTGRTRSALRRALEHRSVEQSVVNLRTFPWIRSRERAGTLTLPGAWFDIALGELHALAGRWPPVG